MYRIIVENTENGERIEYMSRFITAQIRTDGGVYAVIQGEASGRDVFGQCLAIDRVKKELLGKCEVARALYALKDVIPHDEYAINLDAVADHDV